jgi:L,D-peptidoglycan transpeptidase YkuD (ErfK/YbiS/YcfS/YnhG family)
MNIKLKNKYLYFDKYKIKCAIGKRGITSKKVEGDKKTPRGTFRLKSIFYRKDRVSKIKSSLLKKKIKKNMGWCDDVRSKYYNKIINFPFNLSAEKLWLKEKIYDVVVVINYNLKPVIKEKGSAIFLHIAKKNYQSTNGCIAIKKKDMLLLINKINNKTKIIIN